MTVVFDPVERTRGAVAVAAAPATLADLRRSGPHRPYADGLKRVFDFVAALAMLPFVALAVAVLALLVALDGRNPFFIQNRVGRGGKVFRMWKLRTMVPDADLHLQRHLEADAEARAEWSKTQKLRVDPRVTRIGCILRRTSLDELPQLWNVLRGDMSLVGPRPMMTNQQALYSGEAYYRLRPGITGNWQVGERNDTSFADRAVYDLAYDRDLSFLYDLRLLARTVVVVLRGTGC